jgi:hypothetical protein
MPSLWTRLLGRRTEKETEDGRTPSNEETGPRGSAEPSSSSDRQGRKRAGWGKRLLKLDFTTGTENETKQNLLASGHHSQHFTAPLAGNTAPVPSANRGSSKKTASASTSASSLPPDSFKQQKTSALAASGASAAPTSSTSPSATLLTATGSQVPSTQTALAPVQSTTAAPFNRSATLESTGSTSSAVTSKTNPVSNLAKVGHDSGTTKASLNDLLLSYPDPSDQTPSSIRRFIANQQTEKAAALVAERGKNSATTLSNEVTAKPEATLVSPDNSAPKPTNQSNFSTPINMSSNEPNDSLLRSTTVTTVPTKSDPADRMRSSLSSDEKLAFTQSYDDIPIMEGTSLPRGGISFETKAVGRIQVCLFLIE